MTDAANGQIVNNYFSAMRLGPRAEADLLALFSHDAIYIEPFTGASEPAIGRDAIGERFRLGWQTPLPDLELQVITMEVEADSATSRWECRSTGLPAPVLGEDRYEFTEGLISRLEVTILTEDHGVQKAGLDDHQYTLAGLVGYEAIYGRDFVSPGGRATTAAILDSIDWASGTSVLDVGCGLGGAAFMMASEHGARVLAIDVSQNMVEEAARRCDSRGLSANVTIAHGDILTLETGREFDLVHSREVFLHIADKAALFAKLASALKPGGALVFTDYCRGPHGATPAFDAYVTEFGYDLRTVPEVEALLTEAGFTDVIATDETAEFIDIHRRELAKLQSTDLDRETKCELERGWLAKIDRATSGEQRWGWFTAVVPG